MRILITNYIIYDHGFLDDSDNLMNAKNKLQIRQFMVLNDLIDFISYYIIMIDDLKNCVFQLNNIQKQKKVAYSWNDEALNECCARCLPFDGKRRRF